MHVFARCARLRSMFAISLDVDDNSRCARLRSMCTTTLDVRDFARCARLCSMCTTMLDVYDYARCARLQFCSSSGVEMNKIVVALNCSTCVVKKRATPTKEIALIKLICSSYQILAL